MKNRPFKILIYTLVFCFNIKVICAEENQINFSAKNIETIENNKIIASNDVELTNNKNLFIKSENLTFDKKDEIYTLEDNVFLKDTINEIEIKSNKIIYEKKNNLFLSYGYTEIIKNKDYKFESTDIVFDRLNQIIFSQNKATFKDNDQNILELDGFRVKILENVLKSKYSKFIDKEKNIFEINNFKYNFKIDSFLGSDVKLNDNNLIKNDKNLIPRVKSNSIIHDNKNTVFKKAVYTNCKKRDGCPPWLLTAEEVSHDKTNKTINYKNTWLKFYDFPVMYFPKFFHPDPSVKRRSGFLTPVFSSEKNSGSYFNIPYFFAMAENKDFTFSPRIYDDNKVLYQGEYRHFTKNSENIIDASIKNNNLFLLDDNSTESHFFYKSKIDVKNNLFDFSDLKLQVQSTSSDNYLKTYDLKSPLIESQTTMLSKLTFEGSNENLDLLLSTEIYEDLSKKKDSDRYEYIFPNIEISKELETSMEGSLTLNNNGYFKQYDTNINESVLINNLSYKSLDKISASGFITNFEMLIKNFNSEANNSQKLKNETDTSLSGIYQLTTKLPMKKKGSKYNSSLTPIFVAKFNPIKSKNLRTNDNFVDYTNIYSINRIGSNETLESGQSFTLGSEYSIYDNENDNIEIFNFNLATSVRDKKNDDLPLKSSLNQKTSNIVGQMNLNTNKYFDLGYDFLIDNNIDQFNYHKIKSSFTINNFVSSFEFIEENNFIGKESFVSNETSLKLDENKDIKFKTRKNKKTDLTEYYNLIYQYKMDCLTAGIEYQKNYYNDESLKPNEKIFFSITIMPFENKINSPSINK